MERRLATMCDEVDEAIAIGHRVHRALRPGFHERARTDSVAAHARHRAPPPHPRAEPHEGRPHRRGRRCARGAPRGAAHRVRRFGRQPVPGHGDGRGARAQRHDPVDLRRARRQEPHQGARQGRAQDHVEDGHLGRRLVRRRPDVRGDRPLAGVRRSVLHGNVEPARRRRSRRDRRRERGAPRRRLPSGRRPERPRAPRDRRRVPVAPRGAAAPVQPRDDLPTAARDPLPPIRHLPGLHAARRRPGREAHDAARIVQDQGRRAPCCADRRGRARRVHRQAVQHRGDELRLDQPGGAREPRDRDEPARGAVATPARAARMSSGCSTPADAARSSRWHPVGSGSRACT